MSLQYKELALSLSLYVCNSKHKHLFKVEGDNKVAMFGDLLQVLSKRVNISL
jgi:hypothetical protein